MSPHIKSRYLFRTFIIILIVELLIIPSLHFLHLSEWYTEAFINVLLMTLLTYPLLKSFVMSPLIRELETQCRLTQKKLNDARLEQEIAGELEAELIHKIEFQNTYTRTIFDGVDAIVIATDGEHIQEANRSFFNFFSEYPDLAAFKHDHDCICDFFEVTAEDGFVYKNINGELWSDYILKDPERNHKVAIWRDGKRFIMSIKAKKVLFEETKMVIASFYDITALENYKNKLESMVDEKTAELSLTLRSMQDNDMKLRAITDSVQDGIILLDQKGELVFMNPGAKKLLGYEEEELRGKEFHRIVVSEEYYDAYRKGYAHFIQTGQGEVIGRTLELKAIKKNGEHIPVSLSTNSVLLKGKWHAVGLLHDITQRKRYENALLENKNRLQAAIRTSGVGIYDYPIPLDHRAYWSEEWAGIFGFSKTDLPSWEGMIQWISERIHPDDRSAYLSKLEALFHDGTAYNLTKRMRHKSGRWVTVSSVAAVVERNENGTPKRAIGAIQDISDTVAILDELRRNKERFQHLVEDINDWIWEVDGEGNFTYSSPKVISLLDYTPEELIGTSPFILMPEEERQRLAGLLQHLVDSGHPLESLENTLRHKNGKLVTIETNAQPILDEAGKVMGYRGINRDITDRKKLEEELRQKEKLMLAQSRQAAMGDMIAMIAHQWRQPITVIGMAVNNLQVSITLGHETTTEALEKLVAVITYQVQHLSKTIDDFRNFFKPNKEKEHAKICKIIEDTIQIIGKSLENNNIELEYDQSCTLTVYTFPNELLQVFLNLLANAKDAIKENAIENGKITITILEKNDCVETVICDNGGGIRESILSNLGEPYMTTKDENGTGLGLYMSRVIVQKHMGGDILWENQNGGACFTIRLPIDTKKPIPTVSA